MIRIQCLLIFILSFNSDSLFSQKEAKFELLNAEVRRKINVNKSNINFYKAGLFFIEKQWDSTLVYSMRNLEVSKRNGILTDYSHYFRGFSFKQKRIFNEAEKEYNLITKEFDLYHVVKLHLGQIALEKNDFTLAISYLEPLTKLPTEKYKYFDKSTVFQNLGVCYIHLNEFEQAELYLAKNITLNEQKKDSLSLIDAYGSIANLYYQQYKDDLAIPHFEKAYQLSKHIKKFDTKRITAINMAVVEENRKNFRKALVYRKEYEQWKDSLNDQNKIYEVAQIEKAFAVKQKQQEVNLLQAENRAKVQERNGLLYSVLTLIILLGVTFYFYKEKIKTNKIVLAQKERLDELNATKDQLFSIVSHDLRSSVNALKTSNTKLLNNLETKNLEALEGALQNNSNIVNGAYNLLDNLLHWALLQTKESYFYREPLRLFFIAEQVAYNYKPLMQDKGISFQNLILKTDKVLADQESLKIILRNLLDNAIKFSKSKDSIKIYTETTNANYCNLIVEDTGVGIDKNTLKILLDDTAPLAKKAHEDTIGTGLGLQLCKSYAKRNNGTFYIESELGKGTKMIVSLPKTE